MRISTPAEAGQRAQEIAATTRTKQQHLVAPSSSSSVNDAMSTLLSHAGVLDNSYHPNNLPLSPSLEFATTYTRPADGNYNSKSSSNNNHNDDDDLLGHDNNSNNNNKSYVYTRQCNPTRLRLETTVAQLELFGGNNNSNNNALDNDNTDYSALITCAFSSGMMAASSLIMAHKMPLTVLLPQDLYHGVSTVLVDVFHERWGVTVQHVDMTNVDTLKDSLLKAVTTSSSNKHCNQEKNPGSIMVWMESPSNPKCHVLDIARICEMVNNDVRSSLRREDTNGPSITTVVDSTLAPPPVVQQPLTLGVDVVVHSGTKYMGGHSDVLLGLTTASPWTQQGRSLIPLIRQVQQCMGGVASPMDSWLTLRGLRTLHVRVERQCSTAMIIAEHLSSLSTQSSSSSLVTAVHYPGLKNHPQHAIAKRQMGGDGLLYGGVLSLELNSEHTAMAFCGALQTIYRATSLGGTETLIEHRASIEPPSRVTSPAGLLRLSVGLEDVNDLIRDIDQALEIAKQVEQELT